MTHEPPPIHEELDEALKRVSRRASVVNVGLSIPQLVVNLPGLLEPLREAVDEALRLAGDLPRNAVTLGTDGRGLGPDTEALLAALLPRGVRPGTEAFDAYLEELRAEDKELGLESDEDYAREVQRWKDERGH